MSIPKIAAFGVNNNSETITTRKIRQWMLKCSFILKLIRLILVILSYGNLDHISLTTKRSLHHNLQINRLSNRNYRLEAVPYRLIAVTLLLHSSTHKFQKLQVPDWFQLIHCSNVQLPSYVASSVATISQLINLNTWTSTNYLHRPTSILTWSRKTFL